MSSLWVVLDTSSESTARRVGHVQDVGDDISTVRDLTVKWLDGAVERISPSKRYRRIRLDSLTALREFAPDQLTEELTTSPMPFARALTERPKQFFWSHELLAIVVDLAGVDEALVQRAWGIHRAAFEAMPEVETEQRPKGPKYHLQRPLPRLALDSAVVEGPASSIESAESAVRASVSDSSATELVNPGERDISPSNGDTHERVGESADARVIEVAEELSRRSSPSLDPETLEAWFASSGPQDALTQRATELEQLRSQPALHAERLGEYSSLVSRILKRADVLIPAETLARAFVALRRSDIESERRRGLEALERLPEAITKPADFLSRIDRPAFQAALAELPFSEGGPRVRVLVTLGRSGGAILDDTGWWRGFGWSDLLAMATGPLSALMAANESLMTMIREVVDDTARDVSTRRGLSGLLSGPRFALEHIEPAQMRSIFEKAAKNDELLARWADEISARAEREDLSRRAEEAEARARQAAERESRAREDLDVLSSQLADVQGQLAALQVASAGLSTRERRQVLIDAAKVVAQVAATVEGDGRSLDHDALTRKVTVLAERFGLHADARPGDSVAFDPSRHSAPGTRPQEGEMVNVARAGYTWEDGEERVVVLPALVTRASGIEESA